MSDFADLDLDEILNAKDDELDEDDEAYRELLKEDGQLMAGFTNARRKQLNWPEPVRKRYLR